MTVCLEVKEGYPKVFSFSWYYRSSSDATKLYELAISLSDKAVTKVSRVPLKCFSTGMCLISVEYLLKQCCRE